MNARITESSKQQRKIYISHKIAIVFAIQAILVLAILIFNSQIITSFNQSFKRMINSDTPKVVHSLQMVSAVYEVQQWLTDVSATADSAGYEDAEAWKKTFKSELASLRKLEKQENDSSIENSLIEADTNFDKLYATGYRMSQAYIQDGRNAGNLIMEDFDSDSTKLAESIDKIKTHYLNKQKNFTESITQNSETQSLWSRLLACALTIIFGIIVFLLVKSINKDVIEPIQKVIDGFTQVENGDLDLSLTIRGTAEVTELGEAFNRCVLRLKEAREKENLLAQESNQLLNEAVRFKQMIENMPTNIILADTDGIITYLNPSSQKTLVGLANLLPIPVEKMQGQNIDVFHRNPKRVRSILSDLNNLPYAATIEFGGEKLDLLVSALYDANKEFAGLMLTWAVVTAMHKAKERDELVKTELNHTIHALEQSSSGLETNSCVLSSNMTQIASNSEQVQNYVNSVSVATEEMISSIAEISKNTERAAQMTKNVVHQMISTEDVIKNLQKQSEEISSILEVVTEIANQTNLLALNATIEAARAGDAGKGFAVVASEVKALATRTTEATEDINHKILAMQAESRNALTSIETATSAVKSIDEVAVTIAGSVEEQTAVTSEIGRSMRSSSEKVEEMASGISNITGLVFSNNEKVGDIKTVTQKLVELV